MGDTKVNAQLFNDIANMIQKQPERYDQGTWGSVRAGRTLDCGTSHCIAGWAATLALPREAWQPDEYGDYDDIVTVDGLERYIGEWAGEVLGLSEEDAERLFSGGWQPEAGMTVPDALRAIGDGVDVYDVTRG